MQSYHISSSRFLIYIQYVLGSLFPNPDLMGGLTPFEKKEDEK